MLKKSFLILGGLVLSFYSVSKSIDYNNNSRSSNLTFSNVEALGGDETGTKDGYAKKFFSSDCKEKENSTCNEGAKSVFGQIVDVVVDAVVKTGMGNPAK